MMLPIATTVTRVLGVVKVQMEAAPFVVVVVVVSIVLRMLHLHYLVNQNQIHYLQYHRIYVEQQLTLFSFFFFVVIVFFSFFSFIMETR